MDFRIEEEIALGKRVRYDPAIHELPQWLSAVFVGDQKNKGLLGRIITAYGYVNDQCVTAAAAAPDVEGAFRASSGRRLHTTVDMVWGYHQLSLSNETKKILREAELRFLNVRPSVRHHFQRFFRIKTKRSSGPFATQIQQNRRGRSVW